MIVAVDCGSTNMKAALYGPDGRRRSEASRPLPYTLHTSSRAELSPEAVRDCFRKMMHDLCDDISSREIRRISFTSQAQTFTVLDSEGRPTAPFLGWEDTRAHQEADELQCVLGNNFHRESGWPLVSPGHEISKVLWMRRENRIDPESRIVSLPSFLAMHLGAMQATDRNLAAMTGLYSTSEKRWWPKAMETAGVEADQLGALVEPCEILEKSGTLQFSEFSPDLDVVMACNDHTAGAVGCDGGSGTLTLGTAGVLYRHAGEAPGPFSPSGLWGPYPRGGYYEVRCLDHACSALNWADQFLYGSVDSPRFAKSASTATITDNTPFFYPNAQGSTAAWVGDGTVEQKAYAVLEGIGFALRNLADENFYTEAQPIIVLGGGSRLDEWVQLVANIFQRTLVRANGDGLDGAAQLAGSPPPPARNPLPCFPPDPSKRELLARRYAGWLRVKRVRTR